VKSKVYQLGIVVSSVACVFLFSNCVESGETIPGKVTGGGWVEVGSGAKANFGFTGSSCDDPSNPTGRFNFHDRTAPGYDGGVRMNGTVIDISQCQEGTGDCAQTATVAGECPEGGYLIQVGYRSTNPRLRGTGTAAACVLDNGEGKKGTGDLIGLGVESGPYQGYDVQGTIHGNIQAHWCK